MPASLPSNAASSPGAPAPATVAGAATPRDWMSHTLRDLERWVAWSIALYTAWLAVFAFPGVPAIWLFVVYAGLVGKWAHARPARRQSDMGWRGVTLIAGAYMLHSHTSPEIGGAIGPFFFWLSITCLYYSFMLKPAWAAGLVGLALIELGVSFAQAPALTAPAEFMVRAGFLCIFPLLLAMRFGAVMRAPDDMLEGARIDSSTALYNQAGFAAHGDELLAECRRDKRPLSVAIFDCADLLEVREIYGSRIARKLTARIVRKLDILSADHGLAARTGPAEFSVVLPGMSREKALAAIARVMGSPMRIELDAGDSEIVMVPGFLVQAAGPDTPCVSQMHDAMRSELALIGHQEQRRQRYLQRERERHSRPMDISVVPDNARPSARANRTQLASTMPAPLILG